MFRVPQLPYKWLVAIVFISGLFMDMVDSTVVNVAIPQLSRDFHASISSVEWTVTGYLLSLALFIPAAGYLSDRFGTKRCFLTAMGIFVAASGLCGQAHGLNELIVFRFLQGAGGGMMTPVGTAMLSREFPGAERAKASALMSVPIVFAPMVGPIFGGYLVTNVSWRWIFYLNLPIGLASFLFALRVLREHKEDYARHGFDLIGLITGSAAAALILYALSEAATLGWTAERVVGCGLGGIAVLGIFVLQELRSKTPIIDLGLFKRPLFVQGNLIMMPAFAMFTGFFFIFTLYLRSCRAGPLPGRPDYRASVARGGRRLSLRQHLLRTHWPQAHVAHRLHAEPCHAAALRLPHRRDDRRDPHRRPLRPRIPLLVRQRGRADPHLRTARKLQAGPGLVGI